MDTVNKKISPIVYLAVFFLGMCFAVTYSLPYIKAIFYDGMLELTGATNAQLGALMTIYGIGEVLTPGIGGLIASKYDYKWIIGISCLGSVGGCLLMAWFPSFIMTAIVWTILIFSSLFMVWGTWFKALRILADDSVQGQMTGWFYGFCGVGYFIVNTVSLYAYNSRADVSATEGMKAVFYTFAVVLLVSTVIAMLVLKKAGVRNPEALEEDTGEKKSIIGEMKAVAKYKSVWYFGITLFCMYSTNISIQYFTPYFTDVLGTAVVFSGFMAIIRQYGMKIIGSPLGGVIADKVGSISKVIIGTFLAAGATIAVVLVLPSGLKTVAVLTAIMLIASLANNMAGGIQYAIPSEANVPVKYNAAAVGFGSAIGFSPDLFQHILHGYWIDKYGDMGYNFIFIYGIVMAVIGTVVLLKFLSEKKADALKAAAENA